MFSDYYEASHLRFNHVNRIAKWTSSVPQAEHNIFML
jgi:hypothetical protein